MATIDGYLIDFAPDPAVFEPVIPPLLLVPSDDSVLGRDIDVLTDLPPNLTLVAGRRNLAQAIARRFTTPEGFLRDFTGDDEAGEYGYDVRALLNAALTADDIASATSLIHAQCVQDPRINDADVSVKFDLASSTLTVVMNLDTDDGPVPLVMTVDALTVSILDGQSNPLV
jgi:hypothetical protein